MINLTKTETWATLAGMNDYGCKLWYTPNNNVYWNSQQAFANDFAIADPTDFVDESNIQFDRECKVDDVFTFETTINGDVL